MRKTLKQGPGVLIGVSTNKPYDTEAVFYDGDEPILEIDLTEPMPSTKTDYGITEPGLEIQMFFQKSIQVECPDNGIQFFVA